MLFLDEIGDMPLALQTRLLRVLQEKEVAPLGASRSVPVNFALICATHRNLTQRVSAGNSVKICCGACGNTPWRCLRCASGRRWKPLSPPCGTTWAVLHAG